MATSINWRDEIVASAKQWPQGFRARLENAGWRLEGASLVIQHEFGQFAERIGSEIGLPPAGEDSVTRLLFRLQKEKFAVRTSHLPRTQLIGGTRTTQSEARVSIHPLGRALVKYLTKPHRAAQIQPRPTSLGNQAAAAKQNRTLALRTSILGALQSLDATRCGEWPDFVVAFSKDNGPPCEQCASPEPFQPPDYDPLNQSPADWAKMANVKWQEHRDAFLARCEFWAATGVDDAIPPLKRVREASRATGKGRRGSNSAIERRYVWAAKYLLGFRIKEIAAKDLADPSSVGRIARQILKLAGWKRPKKTKTAQACH